MLKGKTVVLGVTGSIAAYKAATLASLLKKQSCNVQVIMTKNACQFITPVTFESITGNKCLVDTFDRNFYFEVEHISVAKKADLVVIAPASANVIAKLASGIADDMLTTTVLACHCRKLFAPAMNTGMYENPITQDNMNKLLQYGFEMIAPVSGRLACGDVGNGKMQEPEVILEYILQEIAFEKDFLGKKLLVTAGPTIEAIDPVRYLTNHSSGKMGYAIARAASRRGAEVVLVSGSTNLSAPPFVKTISITSAEEMFQAVVQEAPRQDFIVKAAAVADYTPEHSSSQKQKKTEDAVSLPLVRTKDILKYLGEHKKSGQFLCGFSMETENMIENSRKKLEHKNLDMIAANNLKTEGAGFSTDTNVITIITKDSMEELPIMSKDMAAHALLDRMKCCCAK